MACSMVPLYDGYDYYKKLFELQERLRKSEEERVQLEERFNILMRESHNRHDTCINRLRMRYIEYLEEQRTRDERNYKLLATLDRVMNKLMLINVKKDRLNALRKQYETYLLRVYANRRPLGSTTGDSGIVSQNENKYTRKTIPVVQPNLMSVKARNLSSSRPEVPAQSNQSRSISTSKFNDRTTIVNDSLLNNFPILPTVSLGAPLDYQKTSVSRGSHVYASPIGQSSDRLVQMSAISAPDTIHRHYPRIIPDGSAPRNLQDIPNLRISYAEAPVSSIVSSDQIQSHAIPVNRFFRGHVESAQTAPSLSAVMRFPARDAARYKEMSENGSIPRQIDPLTLLQYRNANIFLSNLQSRIKEHDLSDSAAVEPALASAKSSAYRVKPNTNTINEIGALPRHMDSTLVSPQKSENEESIPSFTSDDIDDLIKRNERLLWKNAETVRSPTVLGTNNTDLDKNRMTRILENELDRYISNIQRLHREHGASNTEELDHEQNTSGDLLNVTLSENALELPVDDRTRKERVPEEMRRILGLVSDLASAMTNLKENERSVRESAEQSRNDNSHVEIGDKIRRREVKSDVSEFKGKSEDEVRGTLAKNEIRKDVATGLTELEQLRADTRIVKENWNDTNDLIDSREHNQKVSTIKKDDLNEEITFSNNISKIDNRRNVMEDKRLDLVTGEESDIEGLFDTVEELAPWNVASMQKNVRELRLDDSDRDQMTGTYVEETADKTGEEIASKLRDSPQFIQQSGAGSEMGNACLLQDTLSRSEMERKKVEASEASEIQEENEMRTFIEDTENLPSKIPSQVDEATSQINAEFRESSESNGKKQDNNEATEPRVDDQSEDTFRDNGYSVEQGYVENLNQAQKQKQDQNEQYYSQRVEKPINEEYEKYANQDYAEEGQEYVEYVDGQYGAYPEDLNNQQYGHVQYEQDPNQTYDYNYDPNQGYEGDLNQQYDSNQNYENNPDNQTYDYTEQVTYKTDQTYDDTYENKGEQRDRDDDVVDAGDGEEKSETEEASRRQADTEERCNSDKDEDEPQQVGAVNEANQLKKKKDVIKSLLDSDTDTTIERNVSNTESDFDFN